MYLFAFFCGLGEVLMNMGTGEFAYGILGSEFEPLSWTFVMQILSISLVTATAKQVHCVGGVAEGPRRRARDDEVLRLSEPARWVGVVGFVWSAAQRACPPGMTPT